MTNYTGEFLGLRWSAPLARFYRPPTLLAACTTRKSNELKYTLICIRTTWALLNFVSNQVDSHISVHPDDALSLYPAAGYRIIPYFPVQGAPKSGRGAHAAVHKCAFWTALGLMELR